MDAAGKVMVESGTKIAQVVIKEKTIRFQSTDVMLPVAGDMVRLKITGLQAGNYTLKIDGQEIVKAAADDWSRGISLGQGSIFAGAEKLREAIVLRNQLFYRRWRPYNDHSRHWGFIGGDFKLYDEDIAAQEKRIAALRSPQPRTFEIVPAT